MIFTILAGTLLSPGRSICGK